MKPNQFLVENILVFFWGGGGVVFFYLRGGRFQQIVDIQGKQIQPIF